jgi:hypothetical protein
MDKCCILWTRKREKLVHKKWKGGVRGHAREVNVNLLLIAFLMLPVEDFLVLVDDDLARTVKDSAMGRCEASVGDDEEEEGAG